METEKKEKIDNITVVLMLSVALFFDGFQALLTLLLIGPFVNWLISIFAWLTFFLWFLLKGVHFTNNPKKILTFMGGSFTEIIPLVSSLPIWTATVALTILMIKAENKLGAPIGKIAKIAKI